MTLRLYNTLTRQKEDFAPLDPSNVRLYVCGPTVYDYAHIGNARPVIVFDVLFRLLRHLYGESHVTYVRNITDIDDKINARAAEIAAAQGIGVEAARLEITDATAKQYLDDVAALGCLPPTHTPRATEYVPRMIAMIEALIASGHAYPAQGHVLFDVSSKADYGKLAKRSLDEMLAGARVEVAPYKKNPMDFVLWKPSDATTPGWDSPWGRGRPGWHIECSAMGEALLGETFDIHGGGIDLMFPHHENEIAQSESAHHGHPLARVWMHNGFLQVEGEKMSKSLGNFVTIRELLAGWRGYNWPGEVIRLAMLMTHYRQPLDFGQDMLEQASIALGNFTTFGKLDAAVPPSPEFLEAVYDDLNTPRVIAELHRLLAAAKGSAWKLADRMSRPGAMLVDDAHSASNQLAAGLLFLGIDIRVYDPQWVQNQSKKRMSESFKETAEILIAARNAARKAKDFKESDRIRDELLAKGVVLKDNADGTTTWEVKR
jgi:cysteinyl-tRNA synthetase